MGICPQGERQKCAPASHAYLERRICDVSGARIQSTGRSAGDLICFIDDQGW
jgi:hypothetical protein